MATYTKFDAPNYPSVDIFSMSLVGFEMRETSSTKVLFVTPHGFDIVITGKNLEIVVTKRPDGTFNFDGKGTVETIARTSVGGSVTYDLITDLGGLPFKKPEIPTLAGFKALVFAGNDTFVGDAKDNSFDGSAGIDTFVLAATQAEATIKTVAGKTTITSSQGVDTLVNIEKIKFKDGSILDLDSHAPPVAGLETGYLPAVTLTQVLTGADPTGAQLDIRFKAAQAAYDYYANVLKVADPSLGPYESLGVSFSGLDVFRSKFGATAGDDLNFITSTYKAVFHRDATATQKDHFAGQIAYFTELYLSADIDAVTAGFQARGAVVGQMIGHVMTSAAERSASGQLIDDQANAFLASVGLVGSSTQSFASIESAA